MKQLLIVASLLTATSCTVQHRPLPPPPLASPPPPPLVEATAITEPEPPPLAPPPRALFLDELPPDVEAAVNKYVDTGRAPIIDHIKTGGYLIFPYGKSQPEVRCQSFAICDIELESGEEVLDLAAADTVRWQFQPLREGPKDRRTTHITVKPQETIPMETGIVVGTDRRVYRIKLKSSPTLHSINVKFYYPEDMVRRFNEAQSLHQQDQAQVVAQLPTVSVENLNYNYRVDGQASFTPTLVMNDGARTYLKMAPEQNTEGLPALFVESNGKPALVNYSIAKGYYIVHGIPEKMILRSGVGSESQEVTVVRGQ